MPQYLNVIMSVVFDGVAFAMILFLISVGLSITMGLMGFINLAHGSFAMVGGYLFVMFVTGWGIPFLVGLVLAFIVVALISVVFERVLYARFYYATELDQVLLTLGLVFMSIAICTFAFGSANVKINVPEYLSGQVDLGFRAFPTYRTFLIVIGFLLMAGLWYGIERTTIGAQIRAAVDNRRMAQSLGIDVDRLFTLTFGLGSGIAAIGGGLGVNVLGLTPFYALEYLIYFLVVVSVGGLGSLRGAFVAALVLGIIDNAGKYFLPHFGAFFIITLTIIILLWRPQGLYGRR